MLPSIEMSEPNIVHKYSHVNLQVLNYHPLSTITKIENEKEDLMNDLNGRDGQSLVEIVC